MAALLGLVGLVEFYWRPILPRITLRWRLGLAVVLVVLAQASAYKTLYDRTGANRKMIDRISAFIEEAVQMKVRYGTSSPHDYDYADPRQAAVWESAVSHHLSMARDRSFCIRFRNRLAPLDNPSNLRRDALVAAIDARLERPEQMQMDLARP